MFAIHGNLLPSCSTYAEAVKVWEKAYQHPRFGDGWRGLKDMRDTNKCVRMKGDAVYFRYHNTDLVTWHPNKIEVVLWDSVSSSTFANRFLPYGVDYCSHKGEYYVRIDGKYYCPKRGSLVLNYDDTNGWQVDLENVYQYVTETLDKKRAAAIRKTVQPFLDWCEAMRRLNVRLDITPAHSIYDVLLSLKTSIDRGHIPEEHYKQLAAGYISQGSGIDLMTQAYVLGGAVSKSPAPLGTPRPINKYQGLRAWDIMSNL